MELSLPLVFATGNADKARELVELLSATLQEPLVAEPLEFLGVTYGFVVWTVPFRVAATPPILHSNPAVEETGATLHENARIKARGMYEALGMPAIADDTGLMITALGDAPGVYSARYAGPNASYEDNVAKVLRDLEVCVAAESGARRAKFCTVVHVVNSDGEELWVEGEVAGMISQEPRGAGTFGYDPIFCPDEGDGRTFAEMEPSEKHVLSHRGRAFRRLLEVSSIRCDAR